MVYIRKNRRRLARRAFLIFMAAALAFLALLRVVNSKIDGFIIPLARTGITREITLVINEAVAEALSGGAGELAAAAYDAGGRVRSVTVDSTAVNLLRAQVSRLVAEKLARIRRFYVEVDASNILDDELLLGNCSFSVSVDVVSTGGVETDVKSEFASAGINQTSYRLSLSVCASVTADVITAFTVDVATSVNIVDMLIVGDVPTVVWG